MRNWRNKVGWNLLFCWVLRSLIKLVSVKRPWEQKVRHLSWKPPNQAIMSSCTPPHTNAYEINQEYLRGLRVTNMISKLSFGVRRVLVLRSGGLTVSQIWCVEGYKTGSAESGLIPLYLPDLRYCTHSRSHNWIFPCLLALIYFTYLSPAEKAHIVSIDRR